MNYKKVKKATTGYEDWLIDSLKDKKEAVLFLETTLEEFQKDGDLKALLLSIEHVVEAIGIHNGRELTILQNNSAVFSAS